MDPFGGDVGLHGLSLGEARNALGESILFDQFGAANTVFRLGGERGVAATVKVQRDDLRNAIATHIQTFAISQAFE